MNLVQPCFNASYLTIGLHGSEQTKFRKRHSKTVGSGKNRRTKYYWKTHYGHKSVVDLVFPIQQYVDGPPRPCMMSYPFSMQIPDWLMPSMYLSTDKESAQLVISYLLRAQVAPIDEKDWMDDKCTVSTFKGERMIFVTKP